tara:strand:- start:697 stop:861 length:165 start_codon:yes stop_codon:yes gene_type:complete
MKVGDLVKRDVYAGYYQIMKIHRNQWGGLRLLLLNLTTGGYARDIRASHVKVLS